ncbi:MAG TPA: InlB B-repeat-containing protein, partial [Methanocorpusculum sp.]|nr:InlB B-repeat-containing protein [Methanocorpusculum sp.]
MKLSIVSDGRPPSSRALHKAVRAVLLSFLIIFVCAAAFCGCVSADETPVELTASNWDELVAKAIAENAGKVINITDQIVLNKSTPGYDNSKEFNLDINGTIINCTYVMFKDGGKVDAFNITDGAKLTVKNSEGTGIINSTFSESSGGIFNVTNGSLTLEDKVLLELNNAKADDGYLVIIKGSSDETKSSYSNFVLNKDAELQTNGKSALYIKQSGSTYSPAYGVNADISGLINISGKRGIHLNGYVWHEDINSPNVTQINIHDGAVIKAENSTKMNLENLDDVQCVAIFAAGYGNWVIDGGTVTGPDAITIDSGKFTITGGEFIGNGPYAELSSKKDGDVGENICGIALKIVTRGGKFKYQGNVSIDITGGTFTSEKNSAVLYQNVNGCRDNLTRLSISGSPSINTNADKYPINITNVTGKNVSVTIGGKTPCYPGLNTSSFTWVNDTNGKWTVTFLKEIKNLENINLSLVKTGSTVKLVDALGHIKNADGSYDIQVWTSNDGKVYKAYDDLPIGHVYTPEYVQKQTFNVKFYPNGGTGEMTVQTFISGKEQALSENIFVKENYEFAGWATEENGPVVYADKQVITIQNAINLYAVWNAIKAPAKNVNRVKKNETSPAIDLNVSNSNVTITNTTDVKKVEIDQGPVNVTLTYRDMTNETNNDGTYKNITGNITGIKATYKPLDVMQTADYNYQSIVNISFELSNSSADSVNDITKLPKITPGVNQTKANQLLKDNPKLKIVSMIEGTSEINANITNLKLEFKVNKTWVDGINKGGKDLKSEVFKAWHIPDDGSAIKEDKIESVDTTSDGYYLVKVTSEYGFSAPTLTATPSEKAAVSGGSSSTSDDNYYDDDDSSSSTTTTPTPTVTPTVKPTQIPTEVPTDTP